MGEAMSKQQNILSPEEQNRLIREYLDGSISIETLTQRLYGDREPFLDAILSFVLPEGVSLRIREHVQKRRSEARHAARL